MVRYQFHQPFFPSLAVLSCGLLALGCSSGIEILLKWMVRLFGGVYLFLFLPSSSRLMRLGPFFDCMVS